MASKSALKEELIASEIITKLKEEHVCIQITFSNDCFSSNIHVGLTNFIFLSCIFKLAAIQKVGEHFDVMISVDSDIRVTGVRAAEAVRYIEKYLMDVRDEFNQLALAETLYKSVTHILKCIRLKLHGLKKKQR